MSGGKFEYIQYTIEDVEDKLKEIIKEQGRINIEEGVEDYYDHFSHPPYEKHTVKEFKKALDYLTLARIYLHRVDWLLSGDDGEECFHERLLEDLLNERLERKANEL